PMTHLDGTAIQDGQVGPITKKLQKSFNQILLQSNMASS
ncbi:D-amino-acid transaminase, partial [Bacillus tropicus]|nr:D-amino-acid transaminase [Bacillus tropicus]